MNRVDGKVAIVTGAGKGIGRGAAALTAGAHPAICVRLRPRRGLIGQVPEGCDRPEGAQAAGRGFITLPARPAAARVPPAGGRRPTMSNETGTSREVATCGVSISADRTRVTIYLGSTDSDGAFEFIMPKDLALHMSSTIQKLTSPPGASTPIKRGARS